MTTLRIEDDSDQLKVPADEIPPVRAAEVPAALEAPPGSAAARFLGATPPVTAPAINAPRQIPGLALRVAAKTAPSKKDPP